MAETGTQRWRLLTAAAAAAVLLAACADENGGPTAEGGDAPPPETTEAMPAETAEAAPAAATETAAVPPPVLEIAGAQQWSGPLSAVAVDLTMTARDQRAWDILWQLIGQPQPGPLPAGAMAVAVFIEGRDAAGYSVDIADVLPAAGGFAIRYRETPPAADPPPAGIGAPYVVRLLARSDGPVVFEEG